MPEQLNRYLYCSALLSVNLSGFLYDLESRNRELVSLSNIAALVLELVKPSRLFRLFHDSTFNARRCALAETNQRGLEMSAWDTHESMVR